MQCGAHSVYQEEWYNLIVTGGNLKRGGEKRMRMSVTQANGILEKFSRDDLREYARKLQVERGKTKKI